MRDLTDEDLTDEEIATLRKVCANKLLKHSAIARLVPRLLAEVERR